MSKTFVCRFPELDKRVLPGSHLEAFIYIQPKPFNYESDTPSWSLTIDKGK